MTQVDEALHLPRHGVALAAEGIPARVVDQAHAPSLVGQAQVGVVRRAAAGGTRRGW
jgi:hypothetical protein